VRSRQAAGYHDPLPLYPCYTCPAYLVPFHPKRVPHFFNRRAVVGGGLAGLRAALPVDPRLSVVVIASRRFGSPISNYAQGRLAAVMDATTAVKKNHVADTLEAGGAALRSGGGRARGGRGACGSAS